MNLKPTHIAEDLSREPSDPYDTAAWVAFYEANPGHRRSVGAAGVNDDEPGGEGDPKPGEDGDPKPGEDDTPPGEGDGDKKPSDKEAKLLKDMMKHKEARRDAEARAAELEEKLGGIDIEEYNRLKEAEAAAEKEKADAEEKRLLERGEFDKIKEQMVQQHQEALTAKEEALAEKDKLLAEARGIIEELTVGSSFSESSFITEDTVFTPGKARQLYDAHFDVEGGKVIGYDKPRGEADRAPIVDASGNPASFDAAMKAIIAADPDHDHIMRAKMKPGGQSEPGKGEAKKPDTAPQSSRDKISAGLVDLMKNIEKPSDGGVKL